MSSGVHGLSRQYPYELELPTLDPLAVAETLGREQELWLYGRPGFYQLAIGSMGKVQAAAGKIEASWQGETLASEPLSEPITQIGNLLARMPIERWRAFGHIAFDAAGYYYPYKFRSGSPLLQFVIPRTLLEFRPNSTEIRTFDEPDSLTQDTQHFKNGLSHALPNAPPPSEGDRDWYEQSVASAIGDIREGQLAKVILSRCINLPGRIDLFSTLAAIRAKNPAARTYGFRGQGLIGVGSSPELLMRTTPEGVILTNPLAGTRPRGANREADEIMKQALIINPKEIKEHSMSVNVAKKELGRVCYPGSVDVNDFMRPIGFRTVWHLGSSIVGRLNETKTVWDALESLFPGVTVSGIEKAVALEKMARIENRARGPYGGCVGWVGSDGSSDLAITLRSAFEDSKGVSISAGAGILAESVPEREYEETVNKMRTIQEQLVLR